MEIKYVQDFLGYGKVLHDMYKIVKENPEYKSFFEDIKNDIIEFYPTIVEMQKTLHETYDTHLITSAKRLKKELGMTNDDIIPILIAMIHSRSANGQQILNMLNKK